MYNHRDGEADGEQADECQDRQQRGRDAGDSNAALTVSSLDWLEQANQS